MLRLMRHARAGVAGISHAWGYVIIGMVTGASLTVASTGMVDDLLHPSRSDLVPITADVELVANRDGTFGVLYEPHAARPTGAVWSVHGVSRDRGVLFTRRGDGQYDDALVQPVLWTWEGIHQGFDTIAPEVPQDPFRLCIYYHQPVAGAEIFRTGPYCTSWSDELEDRP